MVKMEFGQTVTFTAEGGVDRRGRPAKIEAGTAEWTVVATDADGNAVDVKLTPDPDNELSATIESGDVEATGTITLRADGDPDADEESPVVATADFIIDASNVVALTLTNTEPADVVETEEAPTEETPAEDTEVTPVNEDGETV